MQCLAPDGVALFYDERGNGDPSLLLVHGGMGSLTHFAPQVQHFQRNHRTVAVDLRGHGQSDKPPQDYSIAGFADDLAWMCRELRISRPVVVGHSMGGLIALELAARFAELPAAIVILDSPVVAPPAFVEVLQPFVEALRSPSYREAIHQFMGPFMGFSDNPERRARLLDEMCSTAQHVTASTLESYFAYDSVAAASDCNTPVLYVSAGEWFTDVNRFRELCPHLLTGQTVGSGHYHQLEVPEQVNAMIDRFLEIALSRPA